MRTERLHELLEVLAGGELVPLAKEFGHGRGAAGGCRAGLDR